LDQVLIPTEHQVIHLSSRFSLQRPLLVPVSRVVRLLRYSSSVYSLHCTMIHAPLSHVYEKLIGATLGNAVAHLYGTPEHSDIFAGMV
jgi:hypothetical protein